MYLAAVAASRILSAIARVSRMADRAAYRLNRWIEAY